MMTTQAIPEGTRKVRSNDDRMIPNKQPGVTGADTIDDEVSKPPSEASLGDHHAEEARAKKKPRRLERFGNGPGAVQNNIEREFKRVPGLKLQNWTSRRP
jgi:hypothetical protein